MRDGFGLAVVAAATAAVAAALFGGRPSGGHRIGVLTATTSTGRRSPPTRSRLWAVLQPMHRRLTRRRADRAIRDALPGVCARLAAELRAGAAPGAALASVARDAPAPLAIGFARAAAAPAVGGDAAALLAAAHPTLRPVAAVWQVAADAGAGAAAAVERLGIGFEDARRLRGELDAALAGPRAAAFVLAALPAVGLLLAAAIGADPSRFLVRSPPGRACLVAGVGLDLLGLWWTSLIVGRAMR